MPLPSSLVTLVARLEIPLAHTRHSHSQSPCSPQATAVAVAAEDAGNRRVVLGVVAGSLEGLVWGREDRLGELARVMFEGVVVAVVPVAAVAVVVDMLEWVVEWVAVAKVVVGKVGHAGCTFLGMRERRVVGIVVMVGGVA